MLYYALYIIIVNKYGCWISDVKNYHVFFLSSLQFDCVVHALRCMRCVTLHALRYVALRCNKPVRKKGNSVFMAERPN